MNLVISLSNPDILPDTLRTRRVEFGDTGGVIGRHQECDWILDDPERFVSSKHLRIFYKNDTFFAEDISTNGTYLNEHLIGKGNKVPLITGDILRLGRFILSVEQRDDDGLIVDKTGAVVPDVDLLAETTGAGNTSSTDSIMPNDLLAAKGETGEINDFIGDSFVTSDSEEELLTGFAPLPGVQDALPVMRQAETSEAVPSDWMSRKPKDKTPAPTTPSDDSLPSVPQPTGGLDDYGLTPVPPADTPDPKLVSAPEPEPAPAPTPKKAIPAKKSSKKPMPKSTAKVKKAKVKPKKPTNKPTVSPAVPIPAITKPTYTEPVSNDFGTSLAAALSLKPDQATGETGHILGLVMRELLEGSLDMMETRSQMRRELRLSGTTVGARENNPLKFSINYQDALGRMLQGESMGFKPPVESASEVIEDLKRHQLGVLAGIDAGVTALLEAFDPKKISGGKGVMAGLSMMSKLSEQHARITEDTVERTDGVFWRAFTQAYKIAVTTPETQ